MKKIKIKTLEIIESLRGESEEFPKYTTQIMNLANQNAQGTRPKIVGQMSDLIQEFNGSAFEEWEQWYLQKKPDAIEAATERIYSMVEALRDSIHQIDKKMVNRWVHDLVVVKTFAGLRFQEVILQKIAEIYNTTYQLSQNYEESQGIDGYINEIPVSIKPETYKTKDMLHESIAVAIIYYEKSKDGLIVDLTELEKILKS